MPSELLGYILSLTIDNNDWSLQRLRRYALVSQSWLKIVISTPELWGRVYFLDSPSDTKLFLRKSKEAPLLVDVTSKRDTFASPIEDFFDVIAMHRKRISRLKYIGNGTSKVLEHLHANMSSLEELHVHFLWHYRQTWLFQLPVGAPLKVLSLRSASLDWMLGLPSSLTELEVAGIQMLPPTLAQIVDILNATPALQRLSLVDIAQQVEDITALGADETFAERDILLPNLKSFYLRNIPTHICTALIERIDAPVCMRLGVENVPGSLSTDVMSNLYVLLRPILQCSATVCLTLDGSLDRIVINTRPEPFPEPLSDTKEVIAQGAHISFTTVKPFRDLQVLSNFIQSSSITAPLQLDVGKTWWWDDEISNVSLPSTIIQALSTLCSLKFGRGVDPTACLAFLATPTVDLERRVKTWNCPDLVQLEVAGKYDDGQSLLAFLNGRYGSEAREYGPLVPGMDMGIVVPPKTLTSPLSLSPSASAALRLASKHLP